ncbi:MAG: hypothetical protein P4L33_16790 [Capsulimonadaceae bacterium]|nr:hypothetical protein [Capsulimonadaceae bacterium]
MDIPGEVVELYRSRVDVDAACALLPRIGRRNVRRWYRWLAEARGLRMPDYRTIARECRLTVIDTPSANRSGETLRAEALGEYALRSVSAREGAAVASMK